MAVIPSDRSSTSPELPIGDDPSGHGFGTEEAADGRPNLLTPQEAWVCEYNTYDAGTTPSGGTTYGWRRTGQPEPVAAARLPGLGVDDQDGTVGGVPDGGAAILAALSIGRRS